MNKRKDNILVLALAVIMCLIPSCVFAENDSTYIGFFSDIHNDYDNVSKNIVVQWIDRLYDTNGVAFDRIGMCGDLGDGGGPITYWTKVGRVFSALTNERKQGKVNDSAFAVTGNHEYSNGKFCRLLNKITKQYKCPGDYVIDKDGYIMYSLGASRGEERYSCASIAQLKRFLKNNKNYTKPIFILAHYPLHPFGEGSWDNETSKIHDGNPPIGANNLIKALNNAVERHGQNIFLIWGHNHSKSIDLYDVVTTDHIGDKNISFIYASAGAVKYSYGYIKGKGLNVQIQQDNVLMQYCNEEGEPIGDPVVIKLK